MNDFNSNTEMDTKALAGLRRIRRFSNLESNWDGYGALQLNEAVINKAIDFYSQLKYLPQVFPTPRNSIQLEFENDTAYIEIEVFEDQVELFTIMDDVEDERIIDSAQEVNVIIDQLHEPGFYRKSRAFISGDTSGPIG